MAEIELNRLPGPDRPTAETQPGPAWYQSRRLIIFTLVTTVTLVIGLLVVFLRPPIYQASASLLTKAPKAADQAETLIDPNRAMTAPVDPQHVAIQRVLLTAQPLLVETLERLERDALLPEGITPADIKSMLSVEPVPDTNLVALRAEGSDQELLAPLVNTWIDVYMENRIRQIQQTTGVTLDALRAQLAALETKIAEKRHQLDEFRRRYDIASLERSENDVLSRLRGLNESLNKASEEAVLAKTRLEAIKQSIAEGKPVVPESDERVLAVLVEQAQRLREQLTELEQRFTPDYIRLNPQYRKIPKQLKEVEAKIDSLTGSGRKVVLTRAERDYASARQAVEEIRRQLDEQKILATEFSTRFDEHEALVKELEQMEENQRELQNRLTRLEVKQSEDYPQVEVVERAYFPEHPIRPHYWRDALWVLAASLGLGLVAVWLAEFLTRQEKASPETRLTLSGIHVYANSKGQEVLAHAETPQQPILENQPSPNALESPDLRELSRKDIEKLLDSADLRTRQSIALLLCGLTADEITRLDASHFDMNQEIIFSPPPHRRKLPLAPRLKTWMAASGGAPLVPTSEEELAKTIYLTAIEAGLPDPEMVSPETLRHTYLLYLLRQGLKLVDLEKVVGPIPLEDLTKYRRYIPEDKDASTSTIALVHPCLQD